METSTLALLSVPSHPCDAVEFLGMYMHVALERHMAWNERCDRERGEDRTQSTHTV